jgi:uncharacterized membrane protein (DUF4010 family)
MARQSKNTAVAACPAAGAIAAGSVSLFRTALLLLALAPALGWRLLPGLLVAGGIMLAGAMTAIARADTASEADLPGNPFELSQVIKMAVLITVIAFIARAASQIFGDGGLYVVSALTALADVDAATVTVAGMLPALSVDVALIAVGIAVTANMVAKVAYGAIAGSRGFSLRLAAASALAVAGGLIVTFAAGHV